MVFKIIDHPHELLQLLRNHPELAPNSCLIQDPKNAVKMKKSWERGYDHYAIVEDADIQGYARLIDVEVPRSNRTHDGVLDLLFPPKLSDYLADFAREDLGYDRLFLNSHVRWVARRFPDAEITTVNIIVPRTYNRIHFRGGSGQYELIDLLSQDLSADQ